MYNVILLAAGEGTRLRPYTDDRPKCLVELAGRPLLHHNLQVLAGIGLTHVVLVTGYRADCLEGLGLETRHNPDYATTSMVDTLMCAREFLDDDRDTLISYTDIVYEARIVEELLATGDEIAITVDRDWLDLWKLRVDDPLSDAETLRVGRDGLVQEIGGKPGDLREIQGQYMGLIRIPARRNCIVRAAYEAFMKRSSGRRDMTAYLQFLLESSVAIQAVEVTRGWLEVDTVADLRCYRELETQGQLDAFWRAACGENVWEGA